MSTMWQGCLAHTDYFEMRSGGGTTTASGSPRPRATMPPWRRRLSCTCSTATGPWA
ncbi:hypothetical protein ACFQVA_22275 [Actinomadura keratinilytica]